MNGRGAVTLGNPNADFPISVGDYLADGDRDVEVFTLIDDLQRLHDGLGLLEIDPEGFVMGIWSAFERPHVSV